MDPSTFVAPAAGRLVTTVGGAAAFVPSPLPPELEHSWRLSNALARAQGSVGHLRGIGRVLPNPHLLIQPFARREAVLSSRIEGTQASVGDLYLFEIGNPVSERSDVREVSNYVAALDHGFARLQELPVSLRLIREMHAKLLSGVRGESSDPGEFRSAQNWIGKPGTKIEDATYVPPPVAEMDIALDAFEKFLHADSHLPALIRLALVHYQFEAIHPFLDGNGRMGRLLITLLLHTERLLEQPLLYLSAFFEQHRDAYYAHLLGVSQRGAWSEWVEFFLRAVHEQALDAVERANRLLSLRDEYRTRMTAARQSALLLAMIDHLFLSPAVTIAGAARDLDVTYASAKQNVEKLVAARILEPLSEARNRAYMAREILALIE
ncbi:MAG TPA: Fic family protein [Thermoanaerobaculia bacterium]|jgi:Fic family protein